MRAGRMLRSVMLVILAAMFADVLAAAPIKVFLMGGQSNMRGRASVTGLPAALLAPQEDVLICRGTSGTVGTTLQFLQPNNPALDGATFGPDLTFGRTIADYFPAADFALLKYAVGGTALGATWKIGTGTTYLEFRQTVTNGLALLVAAGYEPEIVGMIWHQGESNIGNTQAKYESLLNEFIADMRLHYGANLPFMIGEIGLIEPGSQVIVNAQKAVATADPHAVFVPASDLSFSDNYHFDRNGMVTLGERFAHYYQAYFENLINGPGTENTPPALASTDPANSAVIPVYSNLLARFDEYLVLTGAGSVTIRNLDDGSGASDITINLPDPRVSANGTLLTINPATYLAADTNYAIRISGDAIEDLAGNNFGGILTDGVWFFSTPAPVAPSLVVHEPLADSESTLPGNTPGTGLTGTWAGSTAATIVSGLSYGRLATIGNAAQVAGASGWSNNSVGIAISPKHSALLADGGEMWFSILFSGNVTGVNNVYNRFAFGIGGGTGFGSNGDLASGQAIGFGNAIGKLYAGLWATTNWGADNLQGQPPATALNSAFGTLINNTPALIVGRVQWGANGTTNDIVTLYLPGTDLDLGQAVATSSGIVDQSTFNKLMIHHGTPAVSQFDEIRIGATYHDVMPAINATYTDWQGAQNGGGGTSGGLNDDHDGDGIKNGIEFFVGGSNDTTGRTVLPGIANTGGILSVTWAKADDYPGIYGTDYVLEVSSTLLPGSWGAAVPADLSGDLTYTFRESGPREFVRLKVFGP